MKRFLILAMAVGFLVFGFDVEMVGAVEIPPEKNPLCWEEQACAAIVKKNWGANSYSLDLNFKPGGENKECGGRGYCIPATKAQTAITVGDNSVFGNLGDYIKNIYIYLISIGGLIAAILVIKGGFEYVTSTGNSQRVEGAKETIRNALIGLALLLGSYTLLYTINPDLLKLKLPRTYMIREIALPSQWCEQQPAGTKLAESSVRGGPPIPFNKITKYDFQIPKAGETAGLEKIVCGNEYYVEGGNGQTCSGGYCDKTATEIKICVPKIAGEKGNECVKGNLSGYVTGTNGIIYPFIDNNLLLMAICQSLKTPGSYSHVSYAEIDLETNNSVSQKQGFVFALDPMRDPVAYTSPSADCLKVVGYYFKAEVNEDNANDDWHAVGKAGDTCNKNLAILVGGKGWEDFETAIKSEVDFKKISGYLIPPADLKRPDGLKCDIKLSRTEFLAL